MKTINRGHKRLPTLQERQSAAHLLWEESRLCDPVLCLNEAPHYGGEWPLEDVDEPTFEYEPYDEWGFDDYWNCSCGQCNECIEYEKDAAWDWDYNWNRDDYEERHLAEYFGDWCMNTEKKNHPETYCYAGREFVGLKPEGLDCD